MEESARFISQEGEIRPGVSRRVLVPAPAAGQDWSVKVPGGVWWRVLTIRAQLLTSAAVANRIPSVVVTDGNSVYASVEANANQAAGASVIYSYWAGVVGAYQSVSALRPVLGFPLLQLEQGSAISSVTAGIDGADQWSGVVLAIEERYQSVVELSERAERREVERLEVDAVLAAEAGGAPPSWVAGR